MNRAMAGFLVLLGLFLNGRAIGREVTLEASGYALAAHPLLAREMALADALREAVKQGAGVHVTSLAKVHDFALDYDLVFVRAFGFVREYEVLESGPGDDGLFRVRIRATVSDRDDFTSDREILRMLVQRRGSPRVAIQTRVTIDGIDEMPPVETFLREAALDYQLQIVDLPTIEEANRRREASDPLAARPAAGHMQRSDCDFIIRAEISGGYAGREAVYDTMMHSFGLAVDLTAVWADTGEMVAAVSLPSVQVSSSIDPPTAAARDGVLRLLEGRVAATGGKDAATIFRRSLVKWVAELDIGRRVIIDVHSIDRETFESVRRSLESLPNVNAVYEREFDARRFSRLELDTRLPQPQLIVELQESLTDYRVETATSGYLQLLPIAGIQEPQRDHPGNENRVALPSWFWAMLGLGIAGLLVGVAMLLGRAQKNLRFG